MRGHFGGTSGRNRRVIDDFAELKFSKDFTTFFLVSLGLLSEEKFIDIYKTVQWKI